jgi:hypothetical protein
MKKPLIILFLLLLSYSCTDFTQKDKTITEIESLRLENDSLKDIISEINNKYVFDSISIREIKNDSNTYKLNSLFKTKYYFVGFNKNRNTYMVDIDSIKKDTLQLNKGGYNYSKILKRENNIFEIEVNADNKFGKRFQGTLINKINVED